MHRWFLKNMFPRNDEQILFYEVGSGFGNGSGRMQIGAKMDRIRTTATSALVVHSGGLLSVIT
jgi:hypothetical protein